MTSVKVIFELLYVELLRSKSVKGTCHTKLVCIAGIVCSFAFNIECI